jgi:hypothetical protein
MIIANDMLVPVIEFSLLMLSLGGVKYNPSGRLFVLSSNPVLTDTSYDAMQRAKTDLTRLLGTALKSSVHKLRPLSHSLLSRT